MTLSCLGALDAKVFTLGRLARAALDRRYLPKVAVLQSRPSPGGTLQSGSMAENDLIVPVYVVFSTELKTPSVSRLANSGLVG